MSELHPVLDIWTNPLLPTALVGVAGIVVWRVIPRRRVNTRLIVQIPFFLAMSAILVAWHILPTAPPLGEATTSATVLLGVVKLLWWLHLAWALIGVVRITLVIERSPSEARLLRQVVVGLVYGGMVLSILAFVFAVPVGTLIATSGAVAIVFGLALQSTLADVFSGIALTLGRPYNLGDWIVLSDGTEGRVVETNWRSTHLLGFPNNVVVLPNSVLAKLGITNVSTPDETHGLSITVWIAPTRTPASVVEVMRTVLQSSDLIVREPPPAVAIKGIDATAIELGLIFRVSEVDKRLPATNEVYDLIYRHSRAAGLVLAVPQTTLIELTELPSGHAAPSPSTTPIDFIGAVPFLAALGDDERRVLLAAATLHTFRNGEVIAHAGDVLPSLMIVSSGVVTRERGTDPAALQTAGHLAPGDIFGVGGVLAGSGEEATLRATGRVTIHEIDRQSIDTLLAAHPELEENLAGILSRGELIADATTSFRDRSVTPSAFARKIRSVMRG
jgi:small-conductance mechanosensitive channel